MRHCTILLALLLAGCASKIPKEALELRPDSLELRGLQTRVFETTDEKSLLTAGAGVLQDLGFGIDESETELGVIVGSKERSARDTGQIIGALAVTAIFRVHVATDKDQRIRASLVTSPHTEDKTALRVTFQRVIWNSDGKVSKTESVEDPEIYQEFFEKLSKAVFLEAQAI